MHAPPPRVLIAAPQPAAAAPAKVRKTSARRSPARRRHAAVARHTPSLMQADAHLRSAYASARRAGVSSTVLSDYRDRWDALRLRAPREPRLVSARYDAMAEDLNRMAARHAVERESRPGPWRALRTQIAALWR
jgi:hypothetical protein